MSTHRRVFLAMPALTKRSGQVLQELLQLCARQAADVDVIVVSSHLWQLEGLRVQLPVQQQQQLRVYECDYGSAVAIKATVQKLKRAYPNIEVARYLYGDEPELHSTYNRGIRILHAEMQKEWPQMVDDSIGS